MAHGTVKWFNTTKGFGFISPDDGGKDVLVHITAVQAAGLRGLNEGERVSYDIVMERGKAAASNLKQLPGWSKPSVTAGNSVKIASTPFVLPPSGGRPAKGAGSKPVTISSSSALNSPLLSS
jgi:cold shock protein